MSIQSPWAERAEAREGEPRPLPIAAVLPLRLIGGWRIPSARAAPPRTHHFVFGHGTGFGADAGFDPGADFSPGELPNAIHLLTMSDSSARRSR